MTPTPRPARPMMAKRLEEIRKKIGGAAWIASGWAKPFDHNPDQFAALVAEELLAEVDRLRGLLRPFAELAETIPEHIADDMRVAPVSDCPIAGPTVGDCRRAARALRGET